MRWESGPHRGGTVQILTLEELRPEHEAGVAGLRYIAHSDLYGTEVLRRWRDWGFPLADYLALYAVEGDDVLATVEVHRPRFVLPRGVETVAGLAYVATRPRSARQGLAQRLISEVFEREKSAGLRWVLLWTGKHNVAHGLYEKLGFSDVWATRRALRRVPGAVSLPSGYSAREALEADLPILDALQGTMAQGRPGFSARPRGHLSRCCRADLAGLRDLMVLEYAGRPVGYGLLRKAWEGFTGWESVVEAATHREALLRALEGRAADRWLVLGTTPTDLWEDACRKEGFQILPDSYGVLMARPVVDLLSPAERPRVLGTDRPGFICQAFDFF